MMSGFRILVQCLVCIESNKQKGLKMFLPTDSEALGLVALLIKMRPQPALFIGKKNIDYLSNFIHGYRSATFEVGLAFPQDLLYDEFNKWYLKRHRTKDFVSAIVHIKYKYLDDPVEAVDIFFINWDKFWEWKASKMSTEDINTLLLQRPDACSFPPICHYV